MKMRLYRTPSRHILAVNRDGETCARIDLSQGPGWPDDCTAIEEWLEEKVEEELEEFRFKDVNQNSLIPVELETLPERLWASLIQIEMPTDEEIEEMNNLKDARQFLCDISKVIRLLQQWGRQDDN